MPIYQCCLFDRNDKIVNVEVVGENDDIAARREAMILLVESGQCARYEVWAEGRVVDALNP